LPEHTGRRQESGPASNHRNTYLEQRQIEKSETAVQGGLQKVVIRAPQTDINICMLLPLPAFNSPPINEDLPGRAAAGVYFQ
jgi:hypothetical protein